MPDTKHAVALTSFTLVDRESAYLKDAVILDLTANQFADLESVELVREATPEEVTAAKAEAAPPPASEQPAATE